MDEPPLRVLHYPTDVGGHPPTLARAERELGACSRSAVIVRSGLGYPVDLDLDLGRRSRVGRLLGRAAFACRALREHDVFHFNFGQTFLPTVRGFGVDLPLLRALGRTVFMTYQGSDARPSDPACPREDARKRRSIRHVSRYAHKLFCLNPDLLRFVPGAEFLPYASVDPRQVRPPARPPKSDGPLTILHAPTNRLVKGTVHVEGAARHFAQRKTPLNWLFIENVPHDEAMRRYAQADLVIDQLRIGWYGGFAVEMMAMGKPVVCAIHEEDRQSIPPMMARELPLIVAGPDTLIDVIESLITDPSRLSELGARGRRFVERWHDPRRIARRMLELYRSPNESFWNGFDPDST